MSESGKGAQLKRPFRMPVERKKLMLELGGFKSKQIESQYMNSMAP